MIEFIKHHNNLSRKFKPYAFNIYHITKNRIEMDRS